MPKSLTLRSNVFSALSGLHPLVCGRGSPAAAETEIMIEIARILFILSNARIPAKKAQAVASTGGAIAAISSADGPYAPGIAMSFKRRYTPNCAR